AVSFAAGNTAEPDVVTPDIAIAICRFIQEFGTEPALVAVIGIAKIVVLLGVIFSEFQRRFVSVLESVAMAPTAGYPLYVVTVLVDRPGRISLAIRVPDIARNLGPGSIDGFVNRTHDGNYSCRMICSPYPRAGYVADN